MTGIHALLWVTVAAVEAAVVVPLARVFWREFHNPANDALALRVLRWFDDAVLAILQALGWR